MKRRNITLDEYMDVIGNGIKKTVLVTTRSGDKVNSMAIEWGTVGNIWGRPVFVCYIRQSRFTREMLDSNPEFTVNIPTGGYDRKIISVCGTKSGRDVDKVKEAGLTLMEGDRISVPGIKEMPLTLECRVIYRQKQDIDQIPEDIRKRFYPDTRSGGPDVHITYIGEIVGSYIIEE